MTAPAPAGAALTRPWAGAALRWAGGALLCTAILAFLRGTRLPNLWAATHYAISWEHGFVKRGLLGTLLQALQPALGYGAVAGLAFAVETACVAFLCAAGLGLLRSGERHAWAALVFASSPGLLFFFHEVGYLDQVGALAALGSIALLPRLALAPGALLLLGAGALSGLVHEANLVLFGPVLAVACAARYGAARDRRARWTALALLVSFGALAVLIGQMGTADPATVEALRQDLPARCGFPPRLDALLPLGHGALPQPGALAEFWLRRANYQEILIATLLPALPAGLALLVLWRHEVRRLAGGRRMLGLALALAPLSPLLLYLSGLDFQRWNALTLLALALAIHAAVALGGTAPGAPLPERARLPLTVAVLLGIGCTYPLFDRDRVEPFPFRNHVEHVLRATAGREPWFQVPAE